MYIGVTLAHFRLSWKDSGFNASFTHTVAVSKTKSHFLKTQVAISPQEGFLIPRLFMVFMISVDIHG